MKISDILKYTAVAVSAAIFFIACEKDNFVDDNNTIVSLFAEDGVPTNKLIFTANDDNLVLTADDIKINAKNFSVIKGKLTKKGTIYELVITPGGTGMIRVGLDPYRGFTGWDAKTVNVYADWYFTGTENLTITGYNQLIIDPSETPIPAERADKPITAIGYRAFYNKGLKSVSFSDDIQLKDIRASAFAENQITKIDIPKSVKTIGDTSFMDNQLFEVVIPDGVTDIGYGAFAYNQLTEITIPDSVISIDYSAFLHNQLTTINIKSEKINSIESGVFAYNQLTKVVIPNSVTSIGNGAFGYNNLTKIEIPSSVTILSGFNDNKLTAIDIPDTVIYIGNNAFSNNEITNKTTGFRIPDTVLAIGSYAFSHNKLNKVIISQSITEIKSHAFSYNELTEVIIPDKVITIGNNAFENNQLTAVTIPYKITYIDTYAFMGNPLTKITIGENVTLGSSAFGNGFEKAYYENDRKKGTYTLTGGKWNYAP